MSRRKSEPQMKEEPLENDSAIANSDDKNDSEDDEEVYVVERIIDNKQAAQGVMQYLIKWEGYPSSENSWEGEENILDKDILKEYWERKKAAAEARKEAAAIKRNNSSGGSTNGSATKRQRQVKTGGGGGASAGMKPEDYDSDNEGPNASNWEPLIESIDTVDRLDDQSLVVFIKWKSGKYTKHPADIVYDKCPQMMLRFYEERVRFRNKQ